MATIAQNLQSLIDDRTAIIAAISNKGGTVSDSDGFDDFATAIGTIPSGTQINQGFFNGVSITLDPIYSNILLLNSDLFIDVCFTTYDQQQINSPLLNIYIPLPSSVSSFSVSNFSNVNSVFVTLDRYNLTYGQYPFPTLDDNYNVSLERSGNNKYGKLVFTANPDDEMGARFPSSAEYHLTLHATITL